jgi:hypothetical protein
MHVLWRARYHMCIPHSAHTSLNKLGVIEVVSAPIRSPNSGEMVATVPVLYTQGKKSTGVKSGEQDGQSTSLETGDLGSTSLFGGNAEATYLI